MNVLLKLRDWVKTNPAAATSLLVVAWELIVRKPIGEAQWSIIRAIADLLDTILIAGQ